MGQVSNGPARFRGLRVMAACAALLGSVSEPLAQPARGPQAGAVQQAISDARGLAKDINDDDAPCTQNARAQVEREADALLWQLASLSGIAARAGDQATVYSLQQASRKLRDAVEDYVEDCGKFLPLIRIDGYVRFEENSIGDKAGLGVVVIPGDPFFLRYPDRMALWGTGANVDIRSGDRMHNFGISYGRGSERTSAVEPPGGNAIGYVSGDPADPGINFGAFGASATGKVSLDKFALTYKSMRQFNLDNGFAWGWGPQNEERESHKWLGWTATFDYSGLDYSGHLQRTPDPNNIFADVRHSLNSYRFMAGPAISGKRMLSSNFYLLGQADAQVGFLRSSLDTNEVTCFGCGGVTSTVNLSDSKTSLAWNVSAKAGVGATFASGLDAVLTFGVGWGNHHTADIRQNPGDRGTQVGSATGYNWEIGASLRYAFGAAPPPP